MNHTKEKDNTCFIWNTGKNEKDEFITWLETKKSPKAEKYTYKSDCMDVLERLREPLHNSNEIEMSNGGFDKTIQDLADTWLADNDEGKKPQTYSELKYEICHWLETRGLETIVNGYPLWIRYISMKGNMISQIHKEMAIMSDTIKYIKALEYSLHEWCRETYPKYSDQWIDELGDCEGEVLLEMVRVYKESRLLTNMTS